MPKAPKIDWSAAERKARRQHDAAVREILSRGDEVLETVEAPPGEPSKNGRHPDEDGDDE